MLPIGKPPPAHCEALGRSPRSTAAFERATAKELNVNGSWCKVHAASR
jgi:hypothetical protein